MCYLVTIDDARKVSEEVLLFWGGHCLGVWVVIDDSERFLRILRRLHARFGSFVRCVYDVWR